MGYHQNRSKIVGKKILQPHNGVNIKTVGRLVQHDDIGIAKESLRQHDLDLFAFFQRPHYVPKLIVAHSKALEKLGNIRFSLPAVQLGKLCLQFRRANAVFFGEFFFFVDGVLFLHDIVKLAVAHHHRVKHGVFVKGKVILTKHRHTDGVGNRYLARRGLQLAAKDLQKGGFSRTVGTDDAIAVSGGKFEVNVLEEKLTAKVKAQIGNCDHVTPRLESIFFIIPHKNDVCKQYFGKSRSFAQKEVWKRLRF